MSYNLEIPYNTDDGIKYSLIFMFHQYLDMIHDGLIKPYTPAGQDGMNFTTFLLNGILTNYIPNSIEYLNISKHIEELSNKSKRKSDILYNGIPNLFNILRQKNVWKKYLIGGTDEQWILTVQKWETPTIYSSNVKKNTNLFADIIKTKWTKTNHRNEYITGYANSRQFLSRRDISYPPSVAVDMTHSTGTGAWGIEVLRSARPHTHISGILDAGLVYKGFAQVDGTNENILVRNKLRKQIENLNQRKVSNIITQLLANQDPPVIVNMPPLYENLTTNQQEIVNNELKKIRGEQNRALATLSRTQFQSFDNTDIVFRIFGHTFHYQNANQKVLVDGSMNPQESLSFLSKPAALKAINKQTSLINWHTYLIRFGKYMGDFFQCIAYSRSQQNRQQIRRQNMQNSLIFFTGDMACGLGYMLTTCYMNTPTSTFFPNFMTDRMGTGKNTRSKPTLWYCLTRNLEGWMNLTTLNNQLHQNKILTLGNNLSSIPGIQQDQRLATLAHQWINSRSKRKSVEETKNRLETQNPNAKELINKIFKINRNSNSYEVVRKFDQLTHPQKEEMGRELVSSVLAAPSHQPRSIEQFYGTLYSGDNFSADYPLLNNLSTQFYTNVLSEIKTRRSGPSQQQQPVPFQQQQSVPFQQQHTTQPQSGLKQGLSATTNISQLHRLY